MKNTFLISLLCVLLLSILAACDTAGVAADPAGDKAADTVGKISIDSCAEPTFGTYQLIYAAKGICLLYPDNYDVFQGDDGSLAFYERSLLNTEAPIATLHFEPADGRALEEILSRYLPDVDFTAVRLQTLDLGGETAVLLDNLPGQDINRRAIAIHDGTVVDLMVARIGAEYGAVGEAAEVLFDQLTTSFEFIGTEPHAPLLAGPECPAATAGTVPFANEVDGYCLLLPEGYTTESGGGETAVYVGSPQNSGNARLFITVEDAGGRDLEAVTAARKAEIEAAVGSAVMGSFGHMMDGVFGNQFDAVPGQDLSREMVFVHNGRVYTLIFIPDEAAAGAAYEEMEALHETVTDSFSFMWLSQ